MASGFSGRTPRRRHLIGPRHPEVIECFFVNKPKVVMERMEEIRRAILEKVRRRLANEYGLCAVGHGDTEGFDRILALWIDVQRAIHLMEDYGIEQDDCTPWRCPNKCFQDAWAALTNPGNALALESLLHQLPEGSEMELARKALEICKEPRNAK